MLAFVGLKKFSRELKDPTESPLGTLKYYAN